MKTQKMEIRKPKNKTILLVASMVLCSPVLFSLLAVDHCQGLDGGGYTVTETGSADCEFDWDFGVCRGTCTKSEVEDGIWCVGYAYDQRCGAQEINQVIRTYKVDCVWRLVCVCDSYRTSPTLTGITGGKVQDDSCFYGPAY